MWNGFKNYIAEVIVTFFIKSLSLSGDLFKISDTEVNAMNEIWKVCIPIAMCLLLVYFFLDWNKVMFQMGDSFSIRNIVLCFAKMCAGAAFISIGNEVVGACLDFGTGLINRLQNVVGVGAIRYDDKGHMLNGTDNNIVKTVQEALKNAGIGELLAFFLSLLIPYVIMWLANLVIMYQAYSVKLEIILRAGAMPLAMGDIYEGKQSTAVRNVKKLLALGVAGALMVVLVQVGMMLQIDTAATMFEKATKGDAAAVLGSGINLGTGFVIIPLAVAGMCGSCKQVANDLMGC